MTTMLYPARRASARASAKVMGPHSPYILRFRLHLATSGACAAGVPPLSCRRRRKGANFFGAV
jgi:hypothetical protein